nr:MAG TPA: hypothetical protein [Caudoviricetes sp.]
MRTMYLCIEKWVGQLEYFRDKAFRVSKPYHTAPELILL